jgi:hypothetical protein
VGEDPAVADDPSCGDGNTAPRDGDGDAIAPRICGYPVRLELGRGPRGVARPSVERACETDGAVGRAPGRPGTALRGDRRAGPRAVTRTPHGVGRFMEDIAAAAAATKGKLHACIGHSEGALAMMAARAVRRLRSMRFVCIDSPTHPWMPLRAVQRQLGLPHDMVDAFEDATAREFGTTWPTLLHGSAFAGAGAELLVVHDLANRGGLPFDAERIQSWCAGSRLVTLATDDGDVLASKELVQAIEAFVGTSQSVASPNRGLADRERRAR